MDKIKKVAQRLGIITVEDMERYTALELMMMIANKVNELINEITQLESDTSDILAIQNDRLNDLLNRGLYDEVSTLFEQWLRDGTFNKLINHYAFNTINERINGTDRKMDQKLDKNGVITMANVGQDVREAMTGGSVAVIGKNSVLRENVVNGQITPEKTNFVDNTISFSLIRGSINDGNVTAERQDERLCTQHIIENANKLYIVRTNPDFLIGVWTYDNGVFDKVDRGWQDKDVIEIPKGKGIGFNVRKRDETPITSSDMAQAQSSIEVRYEMKVANQDEVIKLSERLDALSTVQSFSKSDFEVGSITNGGDVVVTTRVRLINYLKVAPGDTIKFNLDASRIKYGVHIYDEDKDWNGIDYGWLTQSEFEVNSFGYLRLVLAYNDGKDITGQWLDEITNNPFTFNGNLKDRIDMINEKVNEKKSVNLSVNDFEIGTITGGVLNNSDLRRVRSKTPIEFKSGDVIKFNKNSVNFNWGISISNLDGTWDGIDYGWLSNSEFTIKKN